MRILIAEDDFVSRRILQADLEKNGYDVIVTQNGSEAYSALSRPDAPQLAILDWMMPELDGVDVCRKIREAKHENYTYILLLTTKGEKEDIVIGLDAGADDYITKPCNPRELLSRVRVGIRMLNLQNSLKEHVQKLEEALTQVRQLQGLLPICCYCKKIQNSDNYWQQVEKYISEHAEVEFSHGICPECYKNVIEEKYKKKEAPSEILNSL